ncbi:MAG: 50S ribosomal protein L6 [Chloroflexota bacterium]
MSRIGNRPVTIPSGVSVSIADSAVAVKGSKGELSYTLLPGISVEQAEGKLSVSRDGDEKPVRAAHGLTRALLANMVIGVSEGYTRSLELVGYRVQAAGKGLNLQLGFSHPVVVQPMDGITFEVEGNNRVHIRGIDKQMVGEQAAQIRRLRPPDAYKGKGVRYLGERLRLKPGKSAAKRA